MFYTEYCNERKRMKRLRRGARAAAVVRVDEVSVFTLIESNAEKSRPSRLSFKLAHLGLISNTKANLNQRVSM